MASIFTDPALVEIVALTFRVTGAALLLATLAGVPLGSLLGMAKFRGRRIVSLILYTGMGLPPVVVGLFVYMALSRSGPLGSLAWLFTPSAMIAAQTILAFPLVTALTMTSVESVDRDLRLQVRALGATRRQLAWTVLRRPASASPPPSSPPSAASSRRSARSCSSAATSRGAPAS